MYFGLFGRLVFLERRLFGVGWFKCLIVFGIMNVVYLHARMLIVDVDDCWRRVVGSLLRFVALFDRDVACHNDHCTLNCMFASFRITIFADFLRIRSRNRMMIGREKLTKLGREFNKNGAKRAISAC